MFNNDVYGILSKTVVFYVCAQCVQSNHGIHPKGLDVIAEILALEVNI